MIPERMLLKELMRASRVSEPEAQRPDNIRSIIRLITCYMLVEHSHNERTYPICSKKYSQIYIEPTAGLLILIAVHDLSITVRPPPPIPIQENA